MDENSFKKKVLNQGPEIIWVTVFEGGLALFTYYMDRYCYYQYGYEYGCYWLYGYYHYYFGYY